MVSGLVSRQDVGCVWSLSSGLTVFGPQAGTAGAQPVAVTAPSPGLCLLTGAHPHGLLLQDQKRPALPGGRTSWDRACSWR